MDTNIQIRKQCAETLGMPTKRQRAAPVNPKESTQPSDDGRVKRMRPNPTTDMISMRMIELKNALDVAETNLDPKLFYDTIRDVRRLVLGSEPDDLQKLLSFGLLPYVTKTLANWRNCNDVESGHVLFEAYWILVELSSHKGRLANSVLKSGAVCSENLTALMSKDHVGVREQTTWLVSNLVAEDAQFHQMVVQQPFLLHSLVTNMQKAVGNDNLSMISTSAWTMTNLLCTRGCRTIMVPRSVVLDWVPCVVSTLKLMVEHNYPPIVDLMEALHRLMLYSREGCTAAFQCGILAILKDVLINYGTKVSNRCTVRESLVIRAIQCLDALASGEQKQAEAVTRSDILLKGVDLLYTGKSLLNQSILDFWLTVATSKDKQVHRSLLEEKIMKEVVKLALGSPKSLQDKAVWILITLGKNPFGANRLYAKFKGLSPLVAFLGREFADVQMLLDTMEAVICLLATNGVKCVLAFEALKGTDHLEALMFHKNDHVVQKAGGILRAFFEVAEDEIRSPTPDATAARTATDLGTFENIPSLEDEFSPPPAKRLFMSPLCSSSSTFGGNVYMNTSV